MEIIHAWAFLGFLALFSLQRLSVSVLLLPILAIILGYIIPLRFTSHGERLIFALCESLITFIVSYRIVPLYAIQETNWHNYFLMFIVTEFSLAFGFIVYVGLLIGRLLRTIKLLSLASIFLHISHTKM